LGELTNEVAHKTPSQLINERIILEAKRMLAHSGQRVTAIANVLGFDDPSYFAKYFKKHAGKTPAQFRKETT
ncbi:MAG TPA: helix-turn-helix domain-containing protein, partial [Gammaproteobacteria bacterium]|nr:helix-turn-helix domain-containing protein [Gammaproteobacteria bacterium]